MQIEHFLKVDEWNLNSFLAFVLLFQTGFLLVVSLNSLGFQTPIFSQVIGFCYLIFVPGAVILRLVKMREQSAVEALLFIVGLSLAFLMLLGLLLNTVSLLLPVSLISTLPFTIAISVLTLTLSWVIYARQKGQPSPPVVESVNSFPLRSFAVCLLPLLSVVGAYLMNSYSQNIVLLLMLLILSTLPIVLVFNKIPAKLYPLLIFSISLSLMYFSSLISLNLTGWDIHSEYYFANLVQSNSVWNPNLPFTYNAMLSVVMLGPIFSDISRLSLTWVFKVIYPFLFSLVPVGLYKVFQKRTSSTIAILACFFLMATYTYYDEMAQLARQEIASIFLVLIILLILNGKVSTKIGSALFVIFSVSLVVSHYALAYFLLFALVSAWLILKLVNLRKLQFNFKKITGVLHINRSPRPQQTSLSGNNFIAGWLILLLAAVTFSWYFFVSSSTALLAFVDVVKQIFSSVFSQFINSSSSQGLSLLVTQQGGIFHTFNKGVYLLFQFFIVAGFFLVLFRKGIEKFGKVYMTFSFVCLLIALACIGVPYFSNALNASRLYLITLFFVAPFAILGCTVLFESFGKLFKIKLSSKVALAVIALLLAVFLLFNSGFVYQVTNDAPTAASLNSSLDYPRYSSGEIDAAQWVSTQTDPPSSNLTVYGDDYGYLLLLQFNFWNSNTFWGQTSYLQPGSFIFLRGENIKGSVMSSDQDYPLYESFQNSSFAMFLNSTYADKVYDGSAQVYYLPA